MSTLGPDPIRLGTRASALARTQSATVGDALAVVAGRQWREVLIRTHGDDTSRPLDAGGRPGVFVSALRDALLAGDVDVIVHSYKDLPSAPVPGIVLAAVPTRVDPRDGLVSRDGRSLAALPPGAVVGTSSPRRAAAVARLRPDVVIRPVRGNIDSRIAKVHAGEYDAVVLAVAGVTRIGRQDELTEVLDEILPAPAQGALAVECRVGDSGLRAWLARLDDPVSRLTTAAEREVLVGVDATCTTAIAAAAMWDGVELRLRAELTVDGRLTTADVAADLEVDVLGGDGALLAARVLGLQAAATLRGAAADRPPVLLVRAGDDADAAALAAHGIPAISDPYVRQSVLRGPDAEHLVDLLAGAGDRTWLVATSPAAVPSWSAVVGDDRLRAAVATARRAGARAVATGERTAQTLRDAGFGEVAVPGRASAAGVLDLLSGAPAGVALFPCGGQALRTLPDGLRARGWAVEEAVVYDTLPVTDRPASTALLESGDVAAVVLRSPSAVRALLSFVRPASSVRVVCAGQTTAEAAHEAGLRVDAVAASPDSVAVVDAVARVLG